MTNQEASKVIKDGIDDMTLDYFDDEQYEALTMAIKALEQDYICDTCKHKEDSWDTEPCDGCCGNHSGYEPSGDAISRDKVHEIIAVALSEYITDEERETLETLDVDVANIPTVQYPKTGHWISTYGNVKCSVCGSVKESRRVGKATHYCDFCGAKMVEQESEE